MIVLVTDLLVDASTWACGQVIPFPDLELCVCHFSSKHISLLASMPNLIHLSLPFRVATWSNFDPDQELHLLAHLSSLRYPAELPFCFFIMFS